MFCEYEQQKNLKAINIMWLSDSRFELVCKYFEAAKTKLSTQKYERTFISERNGIA